MWWIPWETWTRSLVSELRGLDLPNLDGWAPEALGATIGGLFAAAIAFFTARHAGKVQARAAKEELEVQRKLSADATKAQSDTALAILRAQQRSTFEERRVGAFASVVRILRNVPDAVGMGQRAVIGIHGDINAALADWGMFMADHEVLELELGECIRRVMVWAQASAAGVGTVVSAHDQLTASVKFEGEYGTLMHGAIQHGRIWHTSLDEARRQQSARWIATVAQELRVGPFEDVEAAVTKADAMLVTLPPQGP